jgi:dTDP-4-dehydrorhamnose reductase
MRQNKYSVLVLGVSGMLGHKVFEVLSEDKELDVWGTVTNIEKYKAIIPEKFHSKIKSNVLAEDIALVEKIVQDLQPREIINCIGVIKQNKKSHDIEQMILLNSLFPQQLAGIANKHSARVITIATDCVFDGKKVGKYLESDLPTAHDAYGMTKYLGELHDGNHLTLRTSIIGHELDSNLSLLDWFLTAEGETLKGYTKAIFSGLSTLELAKFLKTYIIGKAKYKGLYHLSTDAISKYSLLEIIARVYKKKVILQPDESIDINRALDSTRLRQEMNYSPPEWEKLITEMHQDYLISPFYNYKKSKL